MIRLAKIPVTIAVNKYNKAAFMPALNHTLSFVRRERGAEKMVEEPHPLTAG